MSSTQAQDAHTEALQMVRALQHWCTCFEMRDAEGCEVARRATHAAAGMFAARVAPQESSGPGPADAMSSLMKAADRCLSARG
ncbi:MAG: hypothetical protein U0637_14190 [Phycisphaerales bacterium]